MICYHGCPCSGSDDGAIRFYRGRHIMVSYAYPEHLPMVADAAASFVLDNGAFTTWKSGQPFDFDGYLAWVMEWCRHPGFTWCLIPDVIDGDEEANDRLLHKWVSQVGTMRTASVPVWHFHESTARLQRLSGHFNTVALGSSGDWPNPGTNSWWERLGEVLPAVLDSVGRPWVRLHGLRMLNAEIVRRVPFTSADSTNASQNAGSVRRFGQYAPPNAWQRAQVIADRIEGAETAACWVPDEQGVLF